MKDGVADSMVTDLKVRSGNLNSLQYTESNANDRSHSEKDPSELIPRKFEVYRLYSKKRDKMRPFLNNRIKTSKYSVWNFLPKNLFYQFMKMSNVYFLMIAILEVILLQ